MNDCKIIFFSSYCIYKKSLKSINKSQLIKYSEATPLKLSVNQHSSQCLTHMLNIHVSLKRLFPFLKNWLIVIFA